MRRSSRNIAGLILVLLLVGTGIYLLQRFGPLRLDSAARAALGPVADCAGRWRPSRGACYQESFTALVRKEGVKTAIATLQALAKVDRDISRDGHMYAHGIGIEGYLHERSIPATFDHCPVDFSSGCGHGVIQAYLESQSAIDSATANSLCDPYKKPGEAIWRLFQCVHGMGHGLNMMYSGDLPRALTTCDLLAEFWDRESCYGGAFMENIMSAIAPHHPATELAAGHEHQHMQHAAFLRLDPKRPLYPCSIMEQKYLQACYEIQTAAILHYNHGSIRKTAQACDGAPEDKVSTCYWSLGRDITSKSRRDPERTRDLCNQSAEEHRPWCYFGAAKALIDWEASAQAGMIFCSTLGQVRGSLLCFRGVGEQIRALVGWTPQRDTLCASAPRPDAVAACRYGAAIPGSTLPQDEPFGAR